MSLIFAICAPWRQLFWQRYMEHKSFFVDFVLSFLYWKLNTCWLFYNSSRERREYVVCIENCFKVCLTRFAEFYGVNREFGTKYYSLYISHYAKPQISVYYYWNQDLSPKTELIRKVGVWRTVCRVSLFCFNEHFLVFAITER